MKTIECKYRKWRQPLHIALEDVCKIGLHTLVTVPQKLGCPNKLLHEVLSSKEDVCTLSYRFFFFCRSLTDPSIPLAVTCFSSLRPKFLVARERYGILHEVKVMRLCLTRQHHIHDPSRPQHSGGVQEFTYLRSTTCSNPPLACSL